MYWLGVLLVVMSMTFLMHSLITYRRSAKKRTRFPVRSSTVYRRRSGLRCPQTTGPRAIQTDTAGPQTVHPPEPPNQYCDVRIFQAPSEAKGTWRRALVVFRNREHPEQYGMAVFDDGVDFVQDPSRRWDNTSASVAATIERIKVSKGVVEYSPADVAEYGHCYGVTAS